MRLYRTLALFALCIVSLQSIAQPVKLYGVTNGQAQSVDWGHIFSVNPGTSEVNTVFAFNGANGWSLTSGVIYASDGFIYGTARYGGAYNKGTIFKVRPDGSNFRVLHDFDGLNGEDSYGGIVEGPGGFLFGTTTSGGSNYIGVVFKIRKDGTGFQKLIDLDYVTTGYSPRSRLLLVGSSFYLTNFQGGLHNMGTILKIETDGTWSKLQDFDGANMGAYPNGALILGTDGFLYGTASGGGANDIGTIFKMNASGTLFVKLFDFSIENGQAPLATLVESSDGALYGTTFGGGGALIPGVGTYYYGALFRINKDGSNFTKLRNFGMPGDGSFPTGGLVEYEGSLYGICTLGGTNGTGTIYRVDLGNLGYQKIYDFEANKGYPTYALTLVREIAPQPEVQFLQRSVTVAEGSGTYHASLNIAPPASSAQRISISVTEGAGISNKYPQFDYSTWPVMMGDSLVLTVPAGSDTVSFSLSPLKDHKRERDEVVTFAIEGVSDGLTVGSQDTLQVTIADVHSTPQLNLYPNPTHGVVNINAIDDGTISETSIVRATLYSPSGGTVAATEGTMSQISQTLSAALQSQQNGIYILTLEIDDDKVELRVLNN